MVNTNTLKDLHILIIGSGITGLVYAQALKKASLEPLETKIQSVHQFFAPATLGNLKAGPAYRAPSISKGSRKLSGEISFETARNLSLLI